MSYSVARYLAQIGKTLSSPDIASSVTTSMARQLMLTMARMSAQLSVDQEFGRSIKDELAASYLGLVADMLPELARLAEATGLVATIRSWQAGSQVGKPPPPLIEIEAVAGQAAVLLCANGNVAGAALANRLVEHELQGLRKGADLCREMLTSGEAVGETRAKQRFTDQQLNEFVDFLKQACGSHGSAKVLEVMQLPGGFSKQTYMVRLTPDSGLPEEVVIRYDPADSVFGVTVNKEFGIINILHERGVHVPEPYALETSGKVLGAPFMVTARAIGGSIGDSYQVDGGSTAFGANLARELAKMHGIAPETFGPGIYGAEIGTKERLLNEIDQFRSLWRESGSTSIAMDCAFQWLTQNVNCADGRRTLIHRDVGCHNLIVQDDEIAALVDWEAAAIGNPAQDLGYSQKTVIQVMPWEDFLAVYAAAGGIIPRAEEIAFYDLWGRVWIGVYAAQARKMFRSGLTDNIQLAYIGEHVFRRDLECIATALSRIRL